MSIVITSATYGVPGTVQVDVKKALQEHVCSHAGCIDLDLETDPNTLFGTDLAPNNLKQLRIAFTAHNAIHRAILSEQNRRFTQQLFVHPTGFLDCVLEGGLTNQIYGVAVALLIAQKLHRNVDIRSLMWIARRNEMDECMGQGAWEKAANCGYLVPLGALFDVQTLLQKLSPVVVSRQGSSLCKDSFATVWLSRPAWPSNEIATHFRSKAQQLTVRNPFWAVVPSTAPDLQFMVRVFNALVPCERLQAFVLGIRNRLGSDFCAIHYRCERDWLKWAAGVKEPLQRELAYIQQQPFVENSKVVYLAGKVPSEILQRFRSVLSPRQVLYKADVFSAIENQLGFEELAVVDRQICIGAHSFIGNSWSTFSLGICVQRNHSRCRFYNKATGYSTTSALLFSPEKKMLFS